ncbi:MAG TPA: hypothetical protein EYP18_09355 [Desulfobacterales bacterium]|nr:hypothetical protein [Desulfobacterales bacterium]
MDPSKEKNQEQTPPANQKSKIVPIVLFALLFTVVCGAAFYFYTLSQKSEQKQSEIETPVTPEENALKKEKSDTIAPFDGEIETIDLLTDPPTSPTSGEVSKEFAEKQTKDAIDIEPIVPLPKEAPIKISICDKPVKQLDAFYTHLDKQAYMSGFKISEPSKNHFSDLIKKLLANPPQVTRESDDLYTILKNTAHFFRISGKDNILMLKGILDNEKASLEQILADYYLLVSSPDCNNTNYGNVDKDALYEYACFFLNTMGGRLYLFRRDSLSRMVVTYYAILLVDEANVQNNNRHGIALRAVVDMLISEMEVGGSSLKDSEIYLDRLYGLKEKYQQ